MRKLLPLIFLVSVLGLKAEFTLNIIPQPSHVLITETEQVTKSEPTIIVDSLLPLPAEGYVLDVSPEGTFIKASDNAGAFYGLVTWDQLPDTIPSLTIEDSPQFPYRGMMIDVSRHFFPKEWIEKQIDMMAKLKLNHLHLHLTDAAGWRVEIDKYPRLTSLAAWRPQAFWKDWNNNGRGYCQQIQCGAYGGYFTKQDLKEIVDYAAMRHITVVPEIEMPSHSEEVMAAYPQLACDGAGEHPSDFCPGKEETFQFLEDVLTEVTGIFPSQLIHIGGDESSKQAWKTCPHCIARMDSLGLENVDQLQSYFISRMGKILTNLGRTMMGWDEILDGDSLQSDVVVMAWRGLNKAKEAGDNGNYVVLTPGDYCYFDAYQDAPYSQPQAFGGYLPLEKAYALNPNADSLKHVVGVQGNMFAEYIPTQAHAEYMLYPRMLAIAEAGWTPQNLREWENFHDRAVAFTANMQPRYHPFDLTTEIGNRPQALNRVHHMAMGKPVIYNIPWWDWYPAGGTATLTDGWVGGWNYNDRRWQGFLYHQDQRMDVTVDLEHETPISSIEIEFMQFSGPGVWFPPHVEFLISNNGSEFRTIKVWDIPHHDSEKVEFQSWEWKGHESARYIRIKATSPEGCLFASEIIVN